VENDDDDCSCRWRIIDDASSVRSFPASTRRSISASELWHLFRRCPCHRTLPLHETARTQEAAAPEAVIFGNGCCDLGGEKNEEFDVPPDEAMTSLWIVAPFINWNWMAQ
jgi:hypothetical protein